MSSKSKTHTQQQAEQFVEMCRYLGLKQLAEGYPELLDQAGKDDPGYYEFIRQIVLSEAAAKQQRGVEYRVRQSHLPQPLKMLSGFDFDFQKKLDRRLVMDLSSMEFIDEKNPSCLSATTEQVRVIWPRVWPFWHVRGDTEPITPPAVSYQGPEPGGI